MAAKNMSAVPSSGVEELLFQNDTVSLCLLVNRRHRSLRIIDFRAGPTLAKRNFVLAAAKREGVEKVYTLVERDEVTTWTRLGFTREGSIPSFYKRSDAWILGAVVSQVGPAQVDPSLGADDDDDDDGPEAAPSPSASLAERTIARARRLLKAESAALPRVTVSIAREADARKALTAAQRQGRALTGFEAFGRDVARTWYAITTRGGFTLHASWESQPCFGNSFLELLTGPRTDAERLATTAAVGAVCERLAGEGIVSTFCLAPADDEALAAVFLANGFRRSGVLARHLLLKGERRDAIVWSKKLSSGAEA
jgi:hypothetical protein